MKGRCLLKKKGILLVNVLILLFILVLISVPIVLAVVQSNNKMTNEVTTTKANEIAYAGFKFMEKYVVENEETYIKSNLDSNKAYSTTVDVPYGDGTEKITVSISTKATLYPTRYLESINIIATADFAGTKGVYEDKIYFEDPFIRPKSVFPYNSFYVENNPIYPSSSQLEDRPGLLERMQVDAVPEINEEHKNWILAQEQTSSVTINTDIYGRVTKNEVLEAIDKLATLPGKDKRWQVIFIDNKATADYYTTIRMDNYAGANQNNRIHTFDFTALGNDEERTSLIILSNKEILCYPYWEFASSTTFAKEAFPTMNIPQIYGALIDVLGGDIYFISYGGGKYGDNGERIGINMSVYNKYNDSLHNLGQITIASTLTRDNVATDFLDAWIGTSKNLFLYYPNRNLEITSFGHYAQYSYAKNNTTYYNYEYAPTYGGVVTKSINWVGVSYRNEFLSIDWKGEPELLGYHD